MATSNPRIRRLSVDGRLPVLSAAQHLHALSTAAGVGGLVTATLRLSGRGVAVDVPTGAGPSELGRLADADAEPYLPVLHWLSQQGWTAACRVGVRPSAEGTLRPAVLLGPAETVVIENSTDGLVMLHPSVTVTVTGEEDHQQALAGYRPSGAQRRRVAVELGWCRIGSGKYRGLHAIEVRLDRRRVGQLTYAMSQRYADNVNRVAAGGGRPGCEALVFRGVRGVELELRLPRAEPKVAAAPVVEPPAHVAPRAAAPPEKGFAARHPLAAAAGVVVAIVVAVNVANGTETPPAESPADPPTTSVAPFTTEAEPTTTTRTRKAKTKRTTTTRPPVEQPPAPQPEPEPADNCHPSYDPCLPNGPDLDCADVSGPVTVSGPDEYRLDRDNDGVGCE